MLYLPKYISQINIKVNPKCDIRIQNNLDTMCIIFMSSKLYLVIHQRIINRNIIKDINLFDGR
jgi:hypothetical protein